MPGNYLQTSLFVPKRVFYPSEASFVARLLCFTLQYEICVTFTCIVRKLGALENFFLQIWNGLAYEWMRKFTPKLESNNLNFLPSIGIGCECFPPTNTPAYYLITNTNKVLWNRQRNKIIKPLAKCFNLMNLCPRKDRSYANKKVLKYVK